MAMHPILYERAVQDDGRRNRANIGYTLLNQVPLRSFQLTVHQTTLDRTYRRVITEALS